MNEQLTFDQLSERLAQYAGQTMELSAFCEAFPEVTYHKIGDVVTTSNTKISVMSENATDNTRIVAGLGAFFIKENNIAQVYTTVEVDILPDVKPEDFVKNMQPGTGMAINKIVQFKGV